MPGLSELPHVSSEFPVLAQLVNHHPLTYLDSASTSLKPRAVVDAVCTFYQTDCANIHRGVHTLSQRATERFEAVRRRVARFLGDVDAEEVIFTRGTTESINLVAESYGRRVVGKGDEVLISELEHHSNLVPWYRLCEQKGAILRVLPVDGNGCPQFECLDELLSSKTRIVALSHVSNTLGNKLDVRWIADKVHSYNCALLIDGAQAAPHIPLSMAELDADFYAFSGHKAYGPMGAGVLWGRRDFLEEMPPWQGGGDMIRSVSLSEGIEFAPIPHRFEAGTPDVAAVIGLGAALEWFEGLGYDDVCAYESELIAYAADQLQRIEGVRLLGPSERTGVLSFVMNGIHPHDAGTILDSLGIAVRTGHHCTEPLMDRLGLPATIRASFGVYNGSEDVDRLCEGIKEVGRVMGAGI